MKRLLAPIRGRFRGHPVTHPGAVVLGVLLLTTSCTSAAPITPALRYQAEFDRVLAANRRSLDADAKSGVGKTYYRFQYALEPTISMWLATRDTRYLATALAWAETMVVAAAITDAAGRRNWSGGWQSTHTTTPIAYFLEEIQGSTGLARLAAVVLQDPTLTSYHVRAAKIRDFVKTHIVDKWLYLRGQEAWCRNNVRTLTEPLSDKSALAGTVVLWLSAVDPDPKYRAFATEMVEGHLTRLRPFQTGVAWDIGFAARHRVPDTSHANRVPALLYHAARLGVGNVGSSLAGLAGLMTGTIWNQQATPAFANFIDGDDRATSACSVAGRCGQIYSGWVHLAAVDARAREVASRTLDAILAGQRNASLDLMATHWGRLSLAGHLTLAQSGR